MTQATQQAKAREAELARRSANGDGSALADLVLPHRTWVCAMAHRYARVGVARDDLISEGMVGLLEAAHRFEPSFGVRFATYARYWVRSSMLSFISRNRKAVAAPATRAMRVLRLNLAKTQRRLEQEAGATVDDEAIARVLNVPAESVREARSVFSVADVPVAHASPEGGECELAADESPETHAAEHEAQAQAVEAAERALEALNQRERWIVSERLMQDKPRSLRELGAQLGVSRERVRQIQAQAVHKMRGIADMRPEASDA